MPEPVPPVAGPEYVTEGFVHDLVEASNAVESYAADGDLVDLKLSCPGYAIAPVRLRAVPPPSDAANPGVYPRPITHYTFAAELQPVATTHAPLAELTVDGLADKDGDTLCFTLQPADRFAPAVSRDESTGVIRVQGKIPSHGDGDDVPDHTVYSEMQDHDLEPLDSVFLKPVWDRYHNAPVSEGVSYADNAVPPDLADCLDAQIGELAASEPVDWHPGSNACVRDLVHPSLYPFVKGESALTEHGKELLAKIDAYVATMQGEEARDRWGHPWPDGESAPDRWGRSFEASKYQWLPTVFQTSEDGHVAIEGYINNLDREKYSGLYDTLAQLFEVFLPRFEKVYAYLKAVKTPDEFANDDGLMDIEREYEPDFTGSMLRGKRLRVITKIVDYELRAETDSIDGVFHVEGMSSDHIVMTGIYVVGRDEDFSGGVLEFKRSFLDFEGSYIFLEINQLRHPSAEEIVEECIRPLGTLHTPKGRMIVFPNSHIHRLTKMARDMSKASGSEVSRRRVVVFWVVDPDSDVLTTAEVPKQQGIMPLDVALKHREGLMEERKKHKAKLNQDRKISLCEH